MSKLNRSELWAVPTEKNLKQSVAGYKANCTRLMNKARSRAEKARIHAEYTAKIAEAEQMFHTNVLAVKRHNAAVKANAARRENTSRNETRKAARSASKKRVMSVAVRCPHH